MQNVVTAEVELDGKKISHYSGITLKQGFNDHHEFTIRLDYDLIETAGALSLGDSKNNIGKTALIRLIDVVDGKSQTVYEFSGTICGLRIEQSRGSNADIILTGYSPTILLEGGQQLHSYTKQQLSDIVKKVAASYGAAAKVNTKYKTVIKYLCQYKESAFHFINRLSAEFGEFFYYDGKSILFGKPATSNATIEIVGGEDVTSLQLTLRTLPATFANYSYNSMKAELIKSDAPKSVQGLGQYSSHVLKESGNLYDQKVDLPSRNRVETQSDLDVFTKSQKSAIAAKMEVLTGTSTNPSISIGAVVNVKISVLKNTKYSKEDYGEFRIINIEHYLNENGKYYNSFEAIPSGSEVIPVNNVIMPVAETQMAKVTNNNDPDKKGRVKVKMLWQEINGEETDWIRVMTPDAGAGDGKNSKKNRGLLCIPEVDDQVLVGFRYNDPDRPFVMGGLFNGKTGEGGGDKNSIKSFSTKTGSIIKFEKDKISIIDAKEKGKMIFDGEGKINIESEEEITLTCGKSSVSMKKDGAIVIKGDKVTIDTTSSSKIICSGGNIEVKSSGGDVKIEGINTELSAQASAKVKANATAELTSSGQTTVKGSIVMIN